LSFKAQDMPVATFWPPAGLLLAALVLSGYRLWPTLLVAAGCANVASDVLWHNKSVSVSLGFCVANSAEACVGAWLMREFVGTPFTLTRIKEVLALAVSALISPLLGATLGAFIVKISFSATSFASVWKSWWLGDAVGVLIVAPVVFGWTGASLWQAGQEGFAKAMRPWRIMEGVWLFAGMALVAQSVYGEWLPPYLTVPIFILPFLLWAGLRFGPRGAATAILLVGIIGLWNTEQGRGPYTVLASLPSQQALRAQGTLAVISLCVLVLAAAVAERERAEQARTTLVGELENALHEIRTLRGLIPLCAWCKKIRDDQGFWQNLEEYLRAHTKAEFTHGICPECLEKELASVGATLQRG
jgi:integral membrane sensor domain MASE1